LEIFIAKSGKPWGSWTLADNIYCHMEIDDKIYIAGHKGLVGSALMRQIKDGNSKAR
jgi:hypothetical protein